MANAIGLNVVEREVADTPVIVPPPLGKSGAVFTSERGPVGVAVQLDSLTFGRKVYGEPNPKFNAFFCLRGLFANAGEGGAQVFGSRVVPGGAAAAQPARKDSTMSPTYDLEPGYTVLMYVDANAPAQTATFNAGPAEELAAGATYPFVFAGTEQLAFKVNGGATITVTFSAGSTTLDNVLAQINAVGSGFSALNSGGQVLLRTDRRGLSATLELLDDTAPQIAGLAALGLTAAALTVANGSGNVANIDAVTAAEAKTVLEAAITDLSVNILGNGKFQLEGVVTGPTGLINITGGTGLVALGLVVGSTVGLAASAAGPTPSSTTAKRGVTDVWTFTSAYLGREDPGLWSAGRVFYELRASKADPTRRDVMVWYKGPKDAGARQVEVFANVAADDVVSRINNPTRGSEYLAVNIEGGDSGVPDVTTLVDTSPVLVDVGTDTAGGDGTAIPTVTDYADALHMLDGLNIQIITNFDLDDAAWATELESYCQGRGDVVGVFQALRGETIAGLVAEFAPINKPKSFIAGYRSYASVSDANGGIIKVPVIGHVIGAGYVRKPRQAGNLPHIAPAGIQTFLLDVLDVDDATYDQPKLLTLMDGCGINPVVFESGIGWFVKGSRTMSTLLKHVSVHVRILTNYIKVAFRRNLSSFEQEGNSPATRRRLKDGILGFMKDLDQKGAFEKAGGFENNVAVICDEGNNTKNIIQQRRMVCDVTFRPVEIAEEVLINVVQTRDGIKVADS